MFRSRRANQLALLLFLIVLAGTGYWYTVRDPVWAKLNLGIDLQGGVEAVLEAKAPPVDEFDRAVFDQAMEQAVRIISNRVDALGVAEPIIQRAGANRIVVVLPGLKQQDEAVALIGRTALLEIMDEENAFKAMAGEPAAAAITGAELRRADYMLDPRTGEPIVTMEFQPAVHDRLRDFTRANVGLRIYFLLDRQPERWAVVQEEIANGEAVMRPYDDIFQAQATALLLNSGALPLELTRPAIIRVSPTLGRDSLQRSAVAAAVAAALVGLYMLAFYRFAGLVAALMLGLYALITLGLLAGLNATLTLPGIAGLILSLGMAVDANVITFERIKEELRNGKTIRASIDAGFSQALRTITDANVTTLIAAAVLFYVGQRAIKGFAVTLGLGILVSLFTAVVVTRFVLRAVVRAGLAPKSRLFFGA